MGGTFEDQGCPLLVGDCRFAGRTSHYIAQDDNQMLFVVTTLRTEGAEVYPRLVAAPLPSCGTPVLW